MSATPTKRVSKEELRFLYNDIIFGFTEFDYFKNEVCFIKHLTPFDSARIDQVTLNAKRKAENMGLNSGKLAVTFPRINSVLNLVHHLFLLEFKIYCMRY